MRPTANLPLGDFEFVIAGKPRIAVEAAVVFMNLRRERELGTDWLFMAFIFQLVR
jgi:hypothetical protein